MHKSLLLLVALGSTAAVAAFALPAAAESGEGACAASPAESGPLNLEAIPVKPATGKYIVRGVGDECGDEASAIGEGTDDGIRADIHGARGAVEERGEVEDD